MEQKIVLNQYINIQGAGMTTAPSSATALRLAVLDRYTVQGKDIDAMAAAISFFSDSEEEGDSGQQLLIAMHMTGIFERLIKNRQFFAAVILANALLMHPALVSLNEDFHTALDLLIDRLPPGSIFTDHIRLARTGFRQTALLDAAGSKQ